MLVYNRCYFTDRKAVEVGTGRVLRTMAPDGMGLMLVSVPSLLTQVRFQRVLLPEERLGWQLSSIGMIVSAV